MIGPYGLWLAILEEETEATLHKVDRARESTHQSIDHQAGGAVLEH